MNLNMELQLKELIKLYEKEAKDQSDEFAHGDGLAKVEAYKRVVEDLKFLIDPKVEEGKVYKIIFSDLNKIPITGRVICDSSDKVIVDCSKEFDSCVLNLEKKKIKSVIKIDVV